MAWLQALPDLGRSGRIRPFCIQNISALSSCPVLSGMVSVCEADTVRCSQQLRTWGSALTAQPPVRKVKNSKICSLLHRYKYHSKSQQACLPYVLKYSEDPYYGRLDYVTQKYARLLSWRQRKEDGGISLPSIYLPETQRCPVPHSPRLLKITLDCT